MKFFFITIPEISKATTLIPFFAKKYVSRASPHPSSSNLDLLFIDAEGYDGRIVNDFLSTVNTRPIIMFEYIHIDNNVYKNLINKLLKKEYLFFSVDENMICYPKENKIKIDLNDY